MAGFFRQRTSQAEGLGADSGGKNQGERSDPAFEGWSAPSSDHAAGIIPEKYQGRSPALCLVVRPPKAITRSILPIVARSDPVFEGQCHPTGDRT
jgi:hypothetical protein